MTLKVFAASRGLAACLVLGSGGVHAQGELFGGVEAGIVHDSNFLAAATGGADRGSDRSLAGSGYLGYFWPSRDLRSALIVRGDAAVVRQQRADQASHAAVGGSVGFYHSFGPVHSMTGSLGHMLRSYENSSRDIDVTSLQLGLKQQLSARFWVREGLVIERGRAATDSDDYQGYGLSGSLNWGPTPDTVLTLSTAVTTREYSASGASRGGYQLGASALRQFGRHLYARLGLTHLRDQTAGGARYASNIFSLGIGASF